MAITETSLYAHCPTCNCSLQVPAAQNWIDPHDSSPCLHLTHNNVIHSLRESPKPLNNQPTTYPLDLISPTNKRIKAGEILDYIRKIIKQQTLCKKHEQVLDRALVELQRSYQVPTDSVENSNLSCDELGGQTDQALIYSFIQLKKIAHCHHCRAPVKDRSNESVPYDGTSGSRTNHAGLIWALLRNWCDVFRSRRPHARRHRDVVRNENADAGPRNRLVGSEPFFSTVDCGTDRVDKSDYCWQWLLTQTEPVLLKDKTTRCSNHVENYSKLLENLTPNISYPTSHSCFSFSWSYRSDRLRYAKAAGIPLRTRSHSMSEISVSGIK
ncbi:unnamed protein product [Echinostoma caproni]|uniref:Uncharacterized protein n=1 Tax=Echinostoma caproni TaxID=27848 RepID=A0A183A7L8_9TREM|nr:unnamed protein product [Echinostoma caproni]